jgi:hypothetical protein
MSFQDDCDNFMNKLLTLELEKSTLMCAFKYINNVKSIKRNLDSIIQTFEFILSLLTQDKLCENAQNVVIANSISSLQELEKLISDHHFQHTNLISPSTLSLLPYTIKFETRSIRAVFAFLSSVYEFSDACFKNNKSDMKKHLLNMTRASDRFNFPVTESISELQQEILTVPNNIRVSDILSSIQERFLPPYVFSCKNEFTK